MDPARWATPGKPLPLLLGFLTWSHGGGLPVGIIVSPVVWGGRPPPTPTPRWPAQGPAAGCRFRPLCGFPHTSKRLAASRAATARKRVENDSWTRRDRLSQAAAGSAAPRTVGRGQGAATRGGAASGEGLLAHRWLRPLLAGTPGPLTSSLGYLKAAEF